MLSEYRQLYAEDANRIKDWRKMSSQELCNGYIENELSNPAVASSYLSALIYKYWDVIPIYYNKCNMFATAEDIYDWLVDSIMYVLSQRVWTDPTSTLYKDKNGADKAIRIRLQSLRINAVVASNRDKRQLQSNAVSLDDITDDFGDFAMVRTNCICEDTYDTTKDIIKKAFDTKDYFTAFMVDGIANAHTFNTVEKEDGIYTEFSAKRLVSHLRHIDDKYCKIFAAEFNYAVDKVKKAYSYVSCLSKARMYTKIKHTLFLLSKDKRIVGK